LPTRDYYFSDNFSQVRSAFKELIVDVAQLLIRDNRTGQNEEDKNVRAVELVQAFIQYFFAAKSLGVVVSRRGLVGFGDEAGGGDRARGSNEGRGGSIQ